jgi:hypothetical protein
MTLPLAQFSPSPAVFRRGTGAISDVIARAAKQSALAQIRSSAAVISQPPDVQIEVSHKGSGTLFKSIPQQAGYEERLFDSLVSLKVAVSQYAMHLAAEERHRIFKRLDSIINVEDWHEEDIFPRVDSFRDFLKWMIFSKNFSWASIGVSNEGNILVAWTTQDITLTANFWGQNRVTWTATIETATPPNHAVGDYSLQNFAKQAQFYLSGGATSDGDEYS